MNLVTMANYVCGKLRLTDSTAVARCKNYIAQRYEMIYADQLWKDSLFCFDFPWDYDGTSAYGYPPGNSQLLTQAGYFILPTSVDRIIALRTADRGLACRPFEIYFRNDLNVFLNAGGPTFEFVILPPVVAMALPSTDVANEVTPTLTITDPEGSDGVGVTFHIEYTDFYGNRRETNFNVQGTDPVPIIPTEAIENSIGTISELLIISRPQTVGFTTLSGLQNGTQNAYVMKGVQTTLEPRLRIRLAQRPNKNVDMTALIKQKCQSLTGDYDVPILRGVSNCLIAFAQADMLEFDHQYAKAQAIAAEGMALLEQLKKQAVVQELNSIQLTPVPEPVDAAFGFPSKSDFI